MRLFAIGDLHLPGGEEKPMDVFGTQWEHHFERISEDWRSRVGEEDMVLIPGDISWAMQLRAAVPDLAMIGQLPGKKVLLKGNHDYWWNTATKMNEFIVSNKFDTIKILHNNSYTVNNTSVCASRGWMFESAEEHDEKILKREVNRIKLSLDSAESEQKIVFLHYPPVTVNSECREILNLLNDYGIKKCFYGHLHGVAAKYAVEGEIDGIDFNLISCDKLKFTPKLIIADKEV